MFFNKKSNQIVSRVRGADGIRECDRPLLMVFQAQCERRGDYEAVRAALKAARDPNFPVTPMTLQRFVSDSDFSNLGMSRRD